jgi:site-specific DNA-methyltransferase (adenine-specific)
MGGEPCAEEVSLRGAGNVKLLIDLHLGDCLEVMADMPDKSVDLIIADPPYNIKKAEWDRIPDYIPWCGEWISQCVRLLKDTGSFYCFHNDMPQVSRLVIWIEENTPFIFKQFIVWNKRFSGCRNKGFLDGFVETGQLRNFQQMAEYLLFYTFQDETGLTAIYADRKCFRTIKSYFDGELDKSSYTQQSISAVLKNQMASHYFGFSKRDKTQWVFPTKEMYCRLQTTGFFRREYEDLRREYEDLRYTFNHQKTHHSVWDYDAAAKNGHVTPKPVSLIENIVTHSSNEGDAVFDPFMGSGTTGVACVRLGRKFIGIEKDPEYFKIAQKRIEQAQEEQALFVTI